jgi:putative aldouronate transport system permease protein
MIMYYKTKSYKAFEWFNYVLLSLIAVICVLPLIHILALSLSESYAVSANQVNLWPVGLNMQSYQKTFDNPAFFKAMFVSIKRVVLATSLSMLITGLAAYALSKGETVVRGHRLFVYFFIISMLFNSGLIPNYVLINNLGLKDTIWALVLPWVVSVYTMILLINFFKALPKEVEESAYIDGADHFQTLIRVVVPLSMPAIATLSLFAIVFQWNSWFDGFIYMTGDNIPMATYLQTIVVQMDFTKTNISPEDLLAINNRTVKGAQIFIGALPVLVVYPFLQKYFAHGVVVGAVKE